jgi:uncharacterized protein DUF5335
MAAREIPRAEWVRFFDQFSRDYLGRTSNLEVISPEFGDQQVADEPQVFRGISADEKDRENRITIMLGPSIEEGADHSVTSPNQVWLEDPDGDTGPTLEIRSEDGTISILRFEKPVLPAPAGTGS